MLLLAACNNTETKDNKADSTSTVTTTTETKTEEAWVPVDSANMMKAMIDYGTPGDMHKMMAFWSGTWNGDITMWQNEGSAPSKMVGTAVSTMVLGGRDQRSNDR